jgi:REase_AHJR-like
MISTEKSRQSFYEQKVISTTQSLLEDGYEILSSASDFKLPFDLDGYSPDLIATKNGGGVIVDIKASRNRSPIDLFQGIAKKISTYPGWRFLIVSLSDEGENALQLTHESLPSWKELASQLVSLDALNQDALFEPSVLFASRILEAILRKRVMALDMPIASFPIINLLNHLFSNGEISIVQFDLFKSFLAMRNSVAHGMRVAVDTETLTLVKAAIQSLVVQWGHD